MKLLMFDCRLDNVGASLGMVVGIGVPEKFSGGGGVALTVREIAVGAPVLSMRLLTVPGAVISVQLVGEGEPAAPKLTPTKVAPETAESEIRNQTANPRTIGMRILGDLASEEPRLVATNL